MTAESAIRWKMRQWAGPSLSGSKAGIDRIASQTANAAAGAEKVELDELMARADFVTLHLAKTPETIDLINARTLAMAKPSMRIVNVARGGIVNEEDLAAAIRAGTIAGAALCLTHGGATEAAALHRRLP